MSFDNPVTQGTKLVIDAIQSPNYVTGTTGWIVKKDGSAEFNNVDVRGRLHVSGDDSAAIDIDVILGGLPAIKFTNIDGSKDFVMDLTGDSVVNNAFSMTAGTLAMPIPGLYFIEEQGLFLCSDTSGGSSAVGVILEGSSPISAYPGPGFLKRTFGFTGVEDWEDISLNDVGGPTVADQPCQYKLFPDGMVRCRGIANTVTSPIPGGTLMFTLPAGYRPTQNCYFPAIFDASGTHGRWLVLTNGQVTLHEAPNDKPSLDSIQFSVI